MNLDELDELLVARRAFAVAVVGDVYSLYEHPAYKSLAPGAQGAAVVLAGISQERAAAAVAAVPGLLAVAVELDRVVKDAAARRDALSLVFRSDEQISEIAALLQASSISLPDADLAPGQREFIFGPAAQFPMPLQAAFEALRRAFETAREAILEIDRAWARLPEALSALEAEIADLKRSDAFDAEAAGETERIETALAEIKTATLSDPLSVDRRLASEFKPAVHRIRERLLAIERQRDSALAEIADARQILRSLRDLHADTRMACAERTEKVDAQTESAAPVVADDALVDSLAAWHGRLTAAADQGAWREAQAELRDWRRSAHECLTIDQEALAASRALLESRNELRGRFSALKAKAAACGLAESHELGAIGRELGDVLVRRPTPLRQAQRLVAAYQTRLSAAVA